MTDPRVRHWRTLQYHDPADKLRQLRALERELEGAIIDGRVRRLRTNELNRYREWRDAALFTYLIGLATRERVGLATEAASDYDFVTAWVRDDAAHFCPVQLKELVPADLNPGATLDGLLAKLSKYAGPTQTVLAVRLNRRGRVDLARAWPAIPFAQLWFFWASSPDGNRWSIYGDALATPGQLEFAYPT